MNFAKVYNNEDVIQISNSLLGKETIRVNDEIVSEKSSLFGTTHYFDLYQNDEVIECSITTGFGFNGAVFDFHKGGLPIVESQKVGNKAIVAIVFFAIGLYFSYQF